MSVQFWVHLYCASKVSFLWRRSPRPMALFLLLLVTGRLHARGFRVGQWSDIAGRWSGTF